jgi:hypothetical protein
MSSTVINNNVLILTGTGKQYYSSSLDSAFDGFVLG